jgi:hypothetical protein
MLSMQARKLGANQRSITPSAIDPIPPASMAAMRVFHISGVPIFTAVLDRTSARKRSGRLAATDWAIRPPMERPTKMTFGRFRCSMSVMASSA